MKKKTVKINKEYCKGCEMCIAVCPVKILKLSEEFNKSGVHPIEVVGECIGCGKCYLVCPDFAIEVTEDD